MKLLDNHYKLFHTTKPEDWIITNWFIKNNPEYKDCYLKSGILLKGQDGQGLMSFLELFSKWNKYKLQWIQCCKYDKVGQIIKEY